MQSHSGGPGQSQSPDRAKCISHLRDTNVPMKSTTFKNQYNRLLQHFFGYENKRKKILLYIISRQRTFSLLSDVSC